MCVTVRQAGMHVCECAAVKAAWRSVISVEVGQAGTDRLHSTFNTFNDGVGLLQLLPELLESSGSGVPSTDVSVGFLRHAQYLLLHLLTRAARTAGPPFRAACFTAPAVVRGVPILTRRVGWFYAVAVNADVDFTCKYRQQCMYTCTWVGLGRSLNPERPGSVQAPSGIKRQS